ncbi:cytochrome ubiquinol oxidase subunit I [Rhodopila globiformis]|uniref:cytochrome ubiquinol oxidase subunit I n=1 Tax=Rhodopila globiformis TaxID=1071 RepID=UPI00195BD7E6|nr:cytochrome ubiquinol oxidase subunit I [Rhodopila globiformis]
MHLDPLFLSRLQWSWVIAWHIMLPAFTVGLASYIAVLEGLHFFTREEIWFRISGFWTRIFAVSFGMGVVSGIVMPFQFGTNWSRFSDATANVLSPMLGYEDLTAFFLEASFLGVLLFGRKLVPRWAHFFAALMVAGGTLMSSFWILSTNSWMQTPAGYKVVDGRFFPVDWLAIIFNPSFPYRLAHTVTAFYITTGFVVLGVGFYLLRRDKSPEEARRMVRMALDLLIVLVPLQMLLGDAHGLNTREYQPTKLAAIEGVYDTEKPDALSLFGIPDDAAARLDDAVRIPHLGSLILTHTWNGEVRGLKEWPRTDWPPVWPVFFGFRVMVGIGLLMLATAITGWVLRLRHRLFEAGWYGRLCQFTLPLGFVAVIAGWVTTEVGRQPWTVFGLMRTANSVSPSLTGGDVLASLLLYMAVYLIMFPTGILFMAGIVRGGVPGEPEPQQPIEGLQPKTPVTGPAE